MSVFTRPYTPARALEFDSEHLLRTENIAFDIDNWYPRLKPHTFETAFVPLSRPEARAIIRAYRCRYVDRGAVLPAEDARVLEGLEQRLGDVITTKGWGPGVGCFMRLCGRSAKDAEPLDRDRVRREYTSALRALAADAGVDPADAPPELRMRAVGRVSLLKATSGAEVMSLLLSSERVYSDMLDWLWFGEPEQVVLRKWEPELTLDMEFRCYVHKHRLTGISQYDHYCRYSHLFPLKDELERRIVALWKEMHPLVGAESYGMDFGYLPGADKLVMIELSPFLRCTGPHCFRWSIPRDADVLEGRRPFEFRLVSKTAPAFDSIFTSGWTERFWPRDGQGESGGGESGGGDPPPYWATYQTSHQRWAARARHRFRRCLGLGSGSVAPSTGRDRVAVASVALALLAALLTGLGASYPRPRLWPSTAAASVPLLLVLLVLAAAVAEAGAALLGRWRTRRQRSTLLFVYGTLKRGMHWNSKFLSHGAHFVSEATTQDRFPLVRGRCGVPYLLGDLPAEGHRIRGELWRVDGETLEGLDEYEGLEKKYYARRTLRVEAPSSSWRRRLCGRGTGATRVVEAQVYLLCRSSPALRRLPRVAEYTVAWHKEHYKAVEHIHLKQRLYLAGQKEYSCADRRHPPVAVSEDAAAKRRAYVPLDPIRADAGGRCCRVEGGVQL